MQDTVGPQVGSDLSGQEAALSVKGNRDNEKDG